MEPERPPELSGRWYVRTFGWAVAFSFLTVITTWIEVSLNLPKFVGYPLSVVSFSSILLLVFSSLAFPVTAVACVLCVFSARPLRLILFGF
jgi:hypothetical protein